MTLNRVTLITLGVADMTRSRAYYEALGWVSEPSPPEVAFYDMGGAKFGLFQRDALAAEQQRPPQDLGTGAQTLAQNFPSKAGVDSQFAHALTAGAHEIRAPFETDWGGYSSYVADPDGHVWEFAFNPFWDLDEDGRIA